MDVGKRSGGNPGDARRLAPRPGGRAPVNGAGTVPGFRSQPRQLSLFPPPRPGPEERFPWPQLQGIRHWWSPEADRRPIVADPMARALVVLGIVVYVALFAHWTTRNHDGFGTQAFDFGIYDQGLWLLSRFKSPFVTVMGRQLFGDHTSFILLPLVPLYWVLPSGKVLLVVQAAALGVAALPVFLLGREKLRNEMLAALMAVAYLLHPAVGWTNLEQFHPDVLEVPLLLFAIWFMVRERWVGFAVCVGALLLVKEDVAPMVFVLGLYVALRHDRKVGVATSAAAAVTFVAALWWILPALNGVGTLNAWRIPFGGPGGVVRTAILRPGEFLDYVFSPKRSWYLWQMFLPLAGLSLLAPGVLVLAVTPLAANLLTTFYYQYDIHYHYQTLVVPVLVAAAIFAIARARFMDLRRALVGVVIATTVISAHLWGPTPLANHEAPIADPNYPTVAHLHAAIKLIPPDAVVSAFYSYLPHVDHRELIYMFPNPFKGSYWHTFKQEGQRLPEADTVQYVFLPTQLDPEPRAVFDSIRRDFETVYEAGGVTLVRRKGL